MPGHRTTGHRASPAADRRPRRPTATTARTARARRRLPLLAAGLAAALLVAPASASAHAQLVGTSPVSGTTVPVQPKEVIFEFNQNVGGTLGAVRVYNAQGEEVDDLAVGHPEGHERWMGVGLKPHLPDGTYTATYRVISADTHIVYGGLVFNLGRAGPAPRFTVAGLIGRDRAGRVTAIAFGVVRWLDYATLALGVGGLAFLLLAWRPAFAAERRDDERFSHAALAFRGRACRLLAAAVGLGFAASVLGILLQGASAAGVSLWSSLKGAVIESTLDSRFGWVWGGRAIDWLVIAALLLALRRALTGGGTSGSPPARAGLAALGACCAYLVITPALAGHASIESPTGVFFPADTIHVLAASVWVGGIAFLLLALPAATRRLEPADRSRLLVATLRRFSPLALAAVIAIAVTGIVQAYIDVRSLHALLNTTYGALVLAKTGLLTALIGLGWVNRQRVIPALRRLVGAASSPGATGVLARRSMRGELALMSAVFAVTAALISYAPPVDLSNGPFSANARIGSAELEITVEPARVGLNTIHLYLIDARTGAQFTATKELTVTARLPAKGIGPLPLKPYVAGPGHYVLDSAVLSPGGTWSLEVVDRISEFEQNTQVVKVPIR